MIDQTPESGRCTAHVFDIHEDAQVMTIAYYNGGVLVVDLSGLMGISIGGAQVTGAGMKGIGHYQIEGMDSWSAKTPRINPRTSSPDGVRSASFHPPLSDAPGRRIEANPHAT